MNIDTSNYNDVEIEKKVESTPDVTLGELEKAVKTMKQTPNEINMQESISSTDNSSVTKLNENKLMMQSISEATGTKTVSITRYPNNAFSITFLQSGSYSSTPRREAWTQALGSRATISDSLVDGVNYTITSQSYNAYVKNPYYSNSTLHLQADVVVTGYLYGVKVNNITLYEDSNWDTTHIY